MASVEIKEPKEPVNSKLDTVPTDPGTPTRNLIAATQLASIQEATYLPRLSSNVSKLTRVGCNASLGLALGEFPPLLKLASSPVYEMPDNTWFTPYRFLAWTCLSLGPSQGMVYQLSDKTVVKVPFQYPVNTKLPQDEANELLYMSLALFKKESAFYNVLSKKPHPNLAQRLQSKQISGVVLECFRSLEQVWSHYTKEMHLIWIQQLLGALEWLESLGYTHGDLKIHNMGIDGNNQLRLFDFGSTRHRDEEGFYEQILEDHFTLATCIHFLASRIDPVAKASSLAEVRGTLSNLKNGQGVVDKAARDFEEVIQAGWTEFPRPASSFSELRKAITGIIEHISARAVHQSHDSFISSPMVCDDLVVEEDTRWLNEKDYRAAWKARGYETPDDIWN